MKNLDTDLYFIDGSGRRRRAVEIVCKFCNSKFLTRVKNDRKYCSRKCSDSDSIKVELECKWCNSKFLRNPSKVSEICFCSRKCKDEAQRIGGVKEIMPAHYGTSSKHNYERLIENTPNPKCVGCQENTRYLLCVHHIDGNRENDSLENLEITCYNCHAKRHLKQVNKTWIVDFKSLTPREELMSL